MYIHLYKRTRANNRLKKTLDKSKVLKCWTAE